MIGVDNDNRVLRRAGDREEWAKPDFGRPEEEDDGIGIKQVHLNVTASPLKRDRKSI